MSNERYIYCLIDPETSLPFYIGCTIEPSIRLGNHVYNSRHDLGALTLDKYLRRLSLKNVSPIMDVLEKCLAEESDDAEKRWIKRFREWGIPILNIQYKTGLLDKKKIYVKREGMINISSVQKEIVEQSFSWSDYKAIAEVCGVHAETVRLGIRSQRINYKVWAAVSDQYENSGYAKEYPIKKKPGRKKIA